MFFCLHWKLGEDIRGRRKTQVFTSSFLTETSAKVGPACESLGISWWGDADSWQVIHIYERWWITETQACRPHWLIQPTGGSQILLIFFHIKGSELRAVLAFVCTVKMNWYLDFLWRWCITFLFCSSISNKQKGKDTQTHVVCVCVCVCTCTTSNKEGEMTSVREQKKETGVSEEGLWKESQTLGLKSICFVWHFGPSIVWLS